MNGPGPGIGPYALIMFWIVGACVLARIIGWHAVGGLFLLVVAFIALWFVSRVGLWLLYRWRKLRYREP